MHVKTKGKANILLYVELAAAIIVSAAASCAAFSNLLMTPDNMYNVSSDALGHLTKIRYLAEHYKNFEFPSWCPFWYNGSTMMQYYAPLGYIIMAVIEGFLNNVMITMKIYCFASLFLGGLGVWAICRRYIGRWCGLFAAVIYCIQPFLILSLFNAGVLAQGAIYMLTPWFVFFVIMFLQKPQKLTFVLIAILTFLLILGHAMHAFMECLCIAFVALPYVATKKIKLLPYFSLGVAIAIGAAMCGFWWSVGVTGYEAPGVPYLIEEASLLYTANIEWFLPHTMPLSGLKFGFATLICTIVSLIIYKIHFRGKWRNTTEQFAISFCIYLTVFTIIFSFGQNISIFKLIPMIGTLVPGRILSMSSITAAVAGAYIVNTIQHIPLKRKYLKILPAAVNIAVIVLVISDMNPYKTTFSTMNYDAYFEEYMPYLQGEGKAFDKGRYEWIAPVNCAETYFSTIKYGYNTSDGWNIEGTPHNRNIWNYNIALVSGAGEYIAKDLLYWNVRSVYTLPDRTVLLEALEKYGFKFAAKQSEKYGSRGVLYTLDAPSSYFLTDPRDCLVIGQSAGPVALEFPFMVHYSQTDITKLDINELRRYKIIYVVDPVLKTLSQVDEFEKVVSDLVNNGAHVVIEPSNSQILPIFGVSAYDFMNVPGSMLVKQSSADSDKFSIDNVVFGEQQMFRGLIGLDEVYYKLVSKSNGIANDIAGTKNVGTGRVFFVGKHLSQYMKSSNIFIFGFRQDYDYPYADTAKTLLNDIFNLAEHNRSFVPGPFNVISSEWDYKGVNFAYETDEQKEIIISVTHTPRWKIKIDGEAASCRSRENLVVLTLPEGRHVVEMRYGISKMGLAGYIISAIGLMLLIAFCLFFYKIQEFFDSIGKALYKYFEFPKKV